jgi:hypothetical protein
MAGVRHLGCCPTCGGGGTVPDDGTGCCSFLPEADLDGSIEVDVYSEVVGGALAGLYYEETETISGPFVYYPGDVTIRGASLFGGADGLSFVGEQGYYIAGPVCLKFYFDLVIVLGGEPISFKRYFNIRAYAVLACVRVERPIGVPPSSLYDVPRVRLFLVSNRGQASFTTYPATCDDSDPGDLWDWTVAADPTADTIRAHGGFLAMSTVDPDVFDGGRTTMLGGALRASCDPLCIIADAQAGFHFGAVAIRGSIGEVPCDVPDPESCSCRATIDVRFDCPAECPAEGVTWTAVAIDQVSGDQFTAEVSSARDADDDCLYWRATIDVCLTPDEITGLPPESREFEIYRRVSGSPDTLVGTVTVEDCGPASLVVGSPPEFARVDFCVTGCPGAFPGVTATLALLTEDGLTELWSVNGVQPTGEDGCTSAAIRLPDVAGTYLIRVTLPSRSGYSTTVHEIEVTLSAAGTECGAVVDLGTLAYDVNTDTHVCTCGGPVEKCIEWTYNAGDTALLIWNGSRWAGDELHLGRFQGALFCEGDPTLPMAVAVEVWVDENCEWRAERDGRQCLRFNVPCPPTGTPTVFSRPALAANAAGAAVTTRTVPVAVAAWGPDAPFPGVNFATGDWRYSDGSSDPSACLAPPEMYGGANAINCPPVGGGAPLLGDAVAPAPSPSALIAVAGSSVRVPATAAPRARSAWESYFRLPPAHPQKDVKRATLCPMRRPCGCHTIRCNFWGKSRPAADCLGCRIKERYLPPTPRSDPPCS